MSEALLASAETLTERASTLVETDIISGALTPGVRLGIAETAARYGVGATPLREALSRLAARGLVDAVGKRGFRVKAVSYEDLADIIRIRTTIEREAFRLSMANGGGEWEAGVVASVHRLRHYARVNPRGLVEGQREFDALHKAFHTALIAACGSPRMLAAHSDLYDETYRYRRLMLAKFRDPEDFFAAHDRLADLAVRRAQREACAALETHIGSTLGHVYPEAGASPA
ncbi:GntR family transcriptional regulator [Roseiarcus fermentans]|uniref:GntR family transcriptional regulator n=1 Tax=Roseiarcus fermentans TaxID=1473586 RepID=A0A366EIE0_9HYPH|nr:FCD domain-containing protein [Roseiarcus fermentans]RBP01195.1 GntR family transcriptional regulator [Roseiarcus fermentans]